MGGCRQAGKRLTCLAPRRWRGVLLASVGDWIMRKATTAIGEDDMKAGIATDKGLALRDIAQPKPKPNEVLVRVRAAALNRADLATARGVPHGSHGRIGAAVGLEWAGEAVATGAEVTGYKPG